jgi:hypothetical protein
MRPSRRRRRVSPRRAAKRRWIDEIWMMTPDRRFSIPGSSRRSRRTAEQVGVDSMLSILVAASEHAAARCGGPAADIVDEGRRPSGPAESGRPRDRCRPSGRGVEHQTAFVRRARRRDGGHLQASQLGQVPVLGPQGRHVVRRIVLRGQLQEKARNTAGPFHSRLSSSARRKFGLPVRPATPRPPPGQDTSNRGPHALRKASRSALTWSLWVLHSPCGAPG